MTDSQSIKGAETHPNSSDYNGQKAKKIRLSSLLTQDSHYASLWKYALRKWNMIAKSASVNTIAFQIVCRKDSIDGCSSSRRPMTGIRSKMRPVNVSEHFTKCPSIFSAHVYVEITCQNGLIFVTLIPYCV
ncbi:hypothetical protein CEXT_372711 [Caerostris extrusa]|uniref:Uncharacterized protein n=1 Tax=Caerostris extrusa TaxID=172846 RepID=A0AAV4MMB0_CAEEX|nr:hypothetical protein CEXT_372711 [Caerostris extrusa]